MTIATIDVGRSKSNGVDPRHDVRVTWSAIEQNATGEQTHRDAHPNGVDPTRRP